MTDTRIETDSMGEMELPSDALYGPQTARAMANFPISGWRMGRRFICALGRVKRAAAKVNRAAGRLDGKIADAIIAAAGEVVEGELDGHFPLDVFQTGSGTSTNMNANEVIANRAAQLLGAKAGEKSLVHPNDHVNMCQSSNDVIPTVMHVSAARAIHEELVPALRALRDSLRDKAEAFDEVVKIGRTHLMDAVPIRLSQEFAGWSAQIDAVLVAMLTAQVSLCELPIGGTAVGTGLNAPDGFASDVCSLLAEELALPLHETKDHFGFAGARDTALHASGVLKMAAIALGKIASDIRLLGSGPRCGLGELLLPAVQPGSSIMPGKVNPVICESVIQVACQVVGCDAAITAGATGGVGSLLELNVATPMIAMNLLTEIALLASAGRMFEEKCIRGLEANEDRCRELIERSLAMVTALAPKIGYDQAAAIAREAGERGRSIREICTERKILPPDELDKLLDARKQTR